MFSTRASFELAANELALRVEARRASGRPFSDLTDANPTHAALREPERALAAALARLAQDPRALRYAPDARGELRAREAVAAYYARRGAQVDPAHVVLTAGTSEAYAHLFRLLGDPGDELLVPRPSYPLFDLLARFESLETVGYATRPRAGGALGAGEPSDPRETWCVDLDDLAQRASARTRALLAVHPHNPTGAYLSAPERDALRALARGRGLALVVDEVFLDFALAASRPAPSLLADASLTSGPLCFVLSGVSKTLALPQLKLAWIVVAGPPALRDEALARLEVIADTFLAVSTLPQLLLPSLLDAAPAVAAELVARLRANHAALDAAAAGGDGLRLLPVAGGWTGILRIEPGAGSARDGDAREARDGDALVAALLEEHDVLVQPGWLFDLEAAEHGGADHVVLSLLAEPTRFRAAAERLVAGCARWRQAAA